jgi:drug/metabolite transporter (DMT)-like permease
MRTFLALVIVLCLFGGIYLLQGPAFFWPDRWDPSRGVLLSGPSSQLLGAALVIIGGLGLMAAQHASRGAGRAASQRWQIGFFLLLVLALVLISAAFRTGETGPNPDWRAPSAARDQPT